ncbi:metallophosphoesterase [Ornithinimicrobium sp. W1679]|uniref:metallophosphoesterase n=1 Tax=Ornithinimicrobium sp. W1679 TaxID=3418770 RepID=UPI003CF1E602
MKQLLGRAATVLGVVVVALGLWALAEPRLVLETARHTVEIPGLDADQSGVEVAVLSDLQVGMWWANTGMVRRAVDEVVAEEPDLVLLPGDFLYSTEPDVQTQVDTVLELLAPLVDSGIPTLAVLGNHDHEAGGAQEIEAALEDAGIDVLLNESVVVPVAGTGGSQEGGGETGGLHVVGVGPSRPGLADPEKAVADVPPDAPRMVMMHNPAAFVDLPAQTGPLSVAGHTHCGQIALPFAPHSSYLGLTEEEEVVADGWAPDDHGAESNDLFVTCGVGFSLLPVRFNAPPQVAFFELVAPGG